MARLPRIELPGVPLHIIQRGNNRSACFFGDIDRRFFLKCLAEASRRRGCSIHAYVLMSNHVHLLATPMEPGAVAAMMQDLGRRYVRTINTVHGRTGSLWEGRYKSSLVDSESYYLTCHRYIELNPVRADMAQSADSYPWSSHRYYAFGRPDPVISPHSTFASLGSSDAERRESFRSLFHQAIDPATLKCIRDAANSCSALGSEAFLERAESLLGRRVRIPTRGRPVSDPDPRSPGGQSGNLF
jgi:putative transposase